MELINTPEELRFVGGQNVSINMPNIAFYNIYFNFICNIWLVKIYLICTKWDIYFNIPLFYINDAYMHVVTLLL